MFVSLYIALSGELYVVRIMSILEGPKRQGMFGKTPQKNKGETSNSHITQSKQNIKKKEVMANLKTAKDKSSSRALRHGVTM